VGDAQGKCVSLFSRPLPGDVDSYILQTDTARSGMI
jgi:hypothetical protein